MQDKKLNKIETFIAKNTNITGNLSAENETIRIDGEIRGDNIKAHGVIIGVDGRVHANIEANIIIISGQIFGNVKCAQKLEALKSAHITGNVESPLISIEEGCLFEGQCKMTSHNELGAKNRKVIQKEVDDLKKTI